MRRRAFVAGFIGSAVIPDKGRGQQNAKPSIGLLGHVVPEQWKRRLDAFRIGLEEMGFEEGRNVAIEYRWAEGRPERLPELAADLVRRKVSAIAALSTASTLAATKATSTIPIVFRSAVDPVELGLVASLSRPGGNVTGVTTLGIAAGPKGLEFLHVLVPAGRPFSLLVNPANSRLTDVQSKELTAAARNLGRELNIVGASVDSDFDTAFGELADLRSGGLVIGADAFFASRSEQLAAAAARAGVPAVSIYREFAEHGGLLSYGGSIAEASRQAGMYVGRVLKGELPSELPVMRAVKLELVINLKTAAKLSVDVPSALIARADEVIE